MSRTLVQVAKGMRGGLWRCAIGSCLVLLLSTASALEAQQTGTITGLVTNEATGQGISSAQVSLVGTILGGLGHRKRPVPPPQCSRRNLYGPGRDHRVPGHAAGGHSHGGWMPPR